jgi:hypothetical protein
LGQVQRRGVDVNILKRGSRVGVYCFGGILKVYAVLRREFGWGNLSLDFFEDLGGKPRSTTEEGGHLCVSFVNLGEFNWVLPC